MAGGRYEEQRFYSVGSGSVFARGALKKLYRDDMSDPATVLACMQALYDAADDDSATGGPDLSRGIYPVVATITADGYARLPDEQAGEYARTVVEGRAAARTARRSRRERRRRLARHRESPAHLITIST